MKAPESLQLLYEEGDATSADIVAVVTTNYAICHDTEAQLEGLQGWVRGLK